jgi:transposase
VPWNYYAMIRHCNDKRLLRFEMVRYARDFGVKPAARAFDTTVKTVRKWLKRWDGKTMNGLDDLSKAPKKPHNRVSSYRRNKVIELKKDLKSFGAERLKRDFDLPVCPKTARKIWHEEGLLKTKRRKHKTKQDLRAVKARWKLFEQTCMDTKDLIDIPEFWPQIKMYNLPRVQYTAREVVSGMQFIAYAQERALCYSTLFVKILIRHFQNCGIDLSGCSFQTDNGSEFIGSWNSKDDSEFTKTIHNVEGLKHKTIPPGAHTWQADVETAHSLIEDEFYEVQKFVNRDHFLQQATNYSLWFNTARKNSWKGNKTPWEISRERNDKVSPMLPCLPPLFLDDFYFQLDTISQRGYDVGTQPSFITRCISAAPSEHSIS